MVHDGVHRNVERLLPLFDCIYKPFGRVQFLFNEHYRVLLRFRFVFGFFIPFKHVGIIVAHVKLWRISSI